jgi:molybdate transport system ATP-binding protein
MDAGVNQLGHGGLRLQVEQAGPIPLAAALECEAGELLALVGPSGSGKTTLLRTIAGLYRPKHGQVRCNGSIWMDSAGSGRRWVAPQQRRVGVVFQDYALFPHLSALDNLTIAMGHLARPQRARRARELLEMVHLGGLEERFPAQLSGGQQQRVALARALGRDPQVLLLDEPFAAVDEVTRRKLQRELAILRRQLSIPIVLVTHDLQEAAALSDRVVLLYHGKTLQDGPPTEVFNRPDSPLIARLMGHTNLYRGIVAAHEFDRTLISWAGHSLETGPVRQFPAGSVVTWLIPPSHVVMHRRDRSSRGERENLVRGHVSELVAMGETTLVTMVIEGVTDAPLAFSVSSHAARRNALAVGADVSVSLLADGIHLMPADPQTESAAG